MWSSFNYNKNTKIDTDWKGHFIVVLTLLYLGLTYQYSWIFFGAVMECFHYLTTLLFMMVTARWGPLALSKLGKLSMFRIHWSAQELPNLIEINIFIIV